MIQQFLFWVFNPKKTKTLVQKHKSILMVTVGLFIIAELWKQPKCPSIDKWIHPLYIYIYIYTHTYTHTQLHISQV